MRSLSATFFCLTLTLSVLLFDADKHILLSVENPINVVVCNSDVKPLPIYTTDPLSEKVLGNLQPQKSLPHLYDGSVGHWKYVRYEGGTAVLRSSVALKGIEIQPIFIPLWLALSLSLIACLASSVFFVTLFHSSKQRQKVADLQNTASHFFSQSERYQREIEAYQTALKEEKKRLHQQQMETAQLRSNAIKQKRDLETQLRRADAKTRLKIQDLREILKEEAGKEAKIRYEVSLEDMMVSYDKLNDKYKNCIAEARVFGIDFSDKKYESLLKGRQFELYFANDLMENKSFRIMEWTPDKGFDAGIWVESNTHPDFVIADGDENLIAVECKFRSNYFFKDKHKKHISWASEQQGKNYISFARRRNIPVYVAMGLLGVATNPNYHFLVPLDHIMDKSWSREIKKDDVQMICRHSDIYDHFVKAGRYSDRLVGVADYV